MRGEIFKFTKGLKQKRTTFDLSHENKLSCNMADLVPIMCQEILPGDSFRVNAQIMVRFAPLLAPIMHRVDVYTHFFFVPNRLVWDKWEDFITGGQNGTLAPVMPYITGSDIKNASAHLADYLGLPPSVPADMKVCALPFKGYQLIYDNYYIDQNLMEPVDINVDIEGHNQNEELLILRKRCWEKDYFTSALPFSQRGPEVGVSMGGSAPITAGGVHLDQVEYVTLNGQHPVDGVSGFETSLGYTRQIDFEGHHVTNLYARLANNTLSADLSSATPVSINELRRLTKLQEWLERNARGGARYVEQLLSHWGVISPDARLQRPEYLGGGKTPVQISEVMQTSQATEDGTSLSTEAGVGNMYGKGISVGSFHGFNRSFSEHGYVIGIMSIMPHTAYYQGLNKSFFRFDKLDYAWPEFAHLGEQEVKNKEVYVNSILPEGTFGYQSRYAEYKYCCDEVHGDFRTSLNFWHMARKFDSEPALNSEFVEANPTNRIFAVTAEEVQHMWCDIWFDVKASRCLPKYGTPSLV